ncbi:DUF7006 family protein [Enterococcus mundtii]|uniref:Uncharacterized protein n=1 Tax=Enterococcus mundtii TaxID=53346 RepID=A0A242KHA3_ENTMU|nr:hypothetical protein [Enterococcus mundtii]OTP19930.1 hypothetical protein A5802_003334 [Enterococcus mundtii]
MVPIRNREQYLYRFEELLKESSRSSNALQTYLYKQFNQFDKLIAHLSRETFWEIIPVVLGINSKLVLLSELVDCEEFSSKEIIRLTEQDYIYYFKKLCGYNLNMDTKHSILFNIE